jgi:F-type H+-transporting ATPase subunit b
MRSDCRHRSERRCARPLLLSALLALAVTSAPAVCYARQATPAAHAGAQVSGERAAEGQTAEGEHSEGLLPLVAKLVNFAVLVGLLAYFLKSPLAAYLQSRAGEIRQDLVAAADTRRQATEQLAHIEEKVRSLPGELEALKTRGAEDLRAEQARIAQAVAAERQRLLDHTRREIEMRLRMARRELVQYAAELAVRVAEHRVKTAITPEDHLRLMDRYTTQLENVR